MHHPNSRVLFLLLACALVHGACGAEPPAAGNGEPAASASSTPPAAGQGGTPVVAEGLSFTLPAGWTSETPSSPMRIGQAVISGSGGDGQLTVFFFGPGGGGGAEANIGRWVAQVDGTDEPARDSLEANGLSITLVDKAGTLKRSTIGSFPTEDMPGYRLFGAVVEGPGGPWYLKAVGPEATMAEQRDAWLAMLEGASAGG